MDAKDPLIEAALFAVEERLIAGERKVFELDRFRKLILYSDIFMVDVRDRYDQVTKQQPRREFVVEYSAAGEPPIDGVTRFRATSLMKAMQTFEQHTRQAAVEIALRALGVQP